jgi:hypothetical protein
MTTPYYRSEDVTLHLGDCLDVLPTLPDASVDAICTDPPYELTFMGRKWDSTGIAFNPAVWAECLRVLKPGGHLLAFGGTRTYHRLAVAIEDAGFEVRDSIHWIFGSGFPKGQAIDKAIDRTRDDRAAVLKVTAFLSAARQAAGWTHKQIDDLFGFNGMASHWTAVAGKAACVPTPEQWDQLREVLRFDDRDVRALVADLNGRKGTLGEAWTAREVVGEGHRVRRESDVQFAGLSEGAYPITAPASDVARQWQGWSTSLKPAHEPIVLARKSTGFNTTVANVLEHGTGALNIDGCRVAAGQDYRDKCASVIGLDSNRNGDAYGAWTGTRVDSAHEAGRWPTNVVFSHLPLIVDGEVAGDACADGCVIGCPTVELDRQSGDASRFFPVFRYEAKAPSSERPRLADGTAHTTVKPVALMQWLVRLVTPPGGTVLDPFAGSGTTGEACVIEGFRAVLIEREPQHAELIKTRLAKDIQPVLGFGEIA